MAITFINSSSNTSATSGDITVTPPTTQTDDIMILAVSTHDNVGISLPANWTIIDQANNGTGLRATTAWKRCVGAESAFTVTHTAGDGIVGNVAVFRGCSTGTNVIHKNLLTSNASSSTCTASAIVPTTDNCMILFTMHDSDNGASSAQAATSPASFTERFDNSSNDGLDEAVSLASGLQTSATTTGTATGSLSLGPDVNSGTLIALLPQILATTKTLTSTARIQKAVTQTLTATARIKAAATQTITATARIKATVTQTITATARLQKTATQTLTSTARLQKTVAQTITSTASIATPSSTQTITSTARIQKTVAQTITSTGRVTAKTTRTITSTANIRGTTTRTITSTARIASPGGGDDAQTTMLKTVIVLDSPFSLFTSICPPRHLPPG